MTEVRATYELIREKEQRSPTGPVSSFSSADMAAHYAYNLPENAIAFRSLDDMKRTVAASGSHYFDRDAIRFFRGRTHSAAVGLDLWAGRFWVESRKYENAYSGDSAPREYQVAWVAEYHNDQGERFLSIEKLGSFDNLPAARGWAKRLAEAVTEAREVNPEAANQ